MDLTIITTPSRHGLDKSTAWEWFRQTTLKGVSHEVFDATVPFIPRGDRILLMGHKALSLFGVPGGDIFKLSGTYLKVFNRHATCTFDLQDAYDFKPSEEDTKEDTLRKLAKDLQKYVIVSST